MDSIMEFEEVEPASPTAQCFSSSTLSVCILAVLEIQVPIDDSQAKKLLQDVFLPINSRFSSTLIPGKNGEKEWKKVNVKLEDHIYVPDFPTGLSPQSYDMHFDNYLSKLTSEDLPRDRPLWQVHIIKYPTSSAAGSVIFKLHHALGDGFSLMGALLSCLQRADNPSIPLTFPSFQSNSKLKNNDINIIGRIQQTFSSICYTLYDFGWSVMKSSYIKDDPSPMYRPWDAQLKFAPQEISTLTLSLHDIQQIKTKLNVTVNDVIAGIIFLGSRLYMQEVNPSLTNAKTSAVVLLNTRAFHGYKNIQEMCKRSTDSPWGNHFTFLHIPVPQLHEVELSNPVSFVLKTHDLVMRKRSSFATVLFAGLLRLLRKVGGTEAAAGYTRNAINNSCIGISNLVGPLEQMALANHPVKGLYFGFAGVPQCLLVTIISYMGRVRIAIEAEPDLIDIQKYKLCTKKAFNMILEASCQTPPS